MLILFDLDGTLTNSEEGIVKGLEYAIDRMGFKPVDKKILRTFIGPPLTTSFKNIGYRKDEARKTIDIFREYYGRKGMYENIPYDGMIELLEDISSRHTLGVATSKPEEHAKMILEHFKMDQYFKFIGGSLLDGTRVEKGDVIKYVLDNMCREEKTYMVGDRKNDVVGAEENSITSIGVLYGFGSRDELENAGCKIIAPTVKDLHEVLLEL